ncbi:helix-turn-helix transcriptional regulator [Streptomyces sp. VRA16 Mangrove soil]|uniref:helix-turn-helix domain-containing protein n=1 Tax=Streptomyces sp. VRA16 Mangrove soil TaxID=2817434 RepID=UPI001A9CFFA1|nr:helix-turn-helix transcriptional regulator [Streptomyces sp. VRA16 Mangrove soil]MBO1336158.1 LuxR family transcriptional regulator [Streptomyces sp. VRA16 Mangrove soil]
MRPDDVAAQWEALGLGADGLPVYEALLNLPGRHASRTALARDLGLPVRRITAALDQLAEHGFTRPALGSGLPQAVAPATALRGLLHLHQAQVLRRSAELEELTGSVDRISAQLLSTVEDPRSIGIETVRGGRAIAERVAALLVSAREEVALIDRPPYASSQPDGMPTPLDVAAPVRRGARVRAIVDREGLSFQGRARGLNDLAEQGVQIRLGTDLPTKLFTVDRRITLLPPTDAADPTASALVVSDALLGNALVPLFDLLWERAVPIGSAGQDRVTDEDRELLTMLASGLKDEAIARRLDVHVHTVRRRMTRLMQELNAQTRFQAGVQATLRGWLTV